MPHDDGYGCGISRAEGFSPDPLTDLLRQGARDLLAQAVAAELRAFLTIHADQIDGTGRRRLVRHGHLPERDMQTGIGGVTVLPSTASHQKLNKTNVFLLCCPLI